VRAFEKLQKRMRWGGAPITFPRIQGADVCGRIVAVGAGVDPARIGQRVITDGWLRDADDPLNMDKTGYFGSERDGGFAEYTTTPAANALLIDSPLSDAELATFSCSYSTAEGMLTRAGVTGADTVLIPGASGGVGARSRAGAAGKAARCAGDRHGTPCATIASAGAAFSSRSCASAP
jgi:NADPH:quinone reductase-like Zn-dependent oxidoreductase